MSTYAETLERAVTAPACTLKRCEPGKGRHQPDCIPCPVCLDAPAFVVDLHYEIGPDLGLWYVCVQCRSNNRTGCIERHECR